MANDIGGVWRTIGGRRVFIKNGQSVFKAMQESGKYKHLKEYDELDRYLTNRDKFEKYYKKDLHTMRLKYYTELGFDQKPKLMETEEFDKTSKDKIIMTRSTSEEKYNNLIKGKYEISSSENSMYGTGIYFAYDEGDKEYYAKLHSTSKVFDAYVDEKAKMIDSRKLEKIRDDLRTKIKDKETVDNIIFADNGILAATLGYDGVWFDNVKYALIMNRGRLVIKK